jgi:serine/threonine protein kinase
MYPIKSDILFADRYRLIKRIGRGGFAEVWLAADTLTDLQVAIKIYDGMDEDGLKIFVGEINRVYHLNHTNLLKPQHVAAWNNMPYLVMTYCSAGSCEKKIGQIKEQDVWKILHDVASGLAYLHSYNIIHQDIKPANILQDDMGNYVIIDFGISTLARDTLVKSTLRGYTNAGTLAYMAPERFSKDPTPIFASDIWSLGAMFFELLEGKTPFPANIGGGMQQAGAEVPDITADVSKELKLVISKMLSLNTWDRPTAAVLVNNPTSQRNITNTIQTPTKVIPKRQPTKTKVHDTESLNRMTLVEKIFHILTSLWGLFVFVLVTIMLVDDFDILNTQEIIQYLNIGLVNLALACICIAELIKPNDKLAKIRLLSTIIIVFVFTIISLYLASNPRIGYYQYCTFLMPTMIVCSLLQIIRYIRKNICLTSAILKRYFGICAIILIVVYFIPTIVDKIKISKGEINVWVDILNSDENISEIYDDEVFYVRLNNLQNYRRISYQVDGANYTNHLLDVDEYIPSKGIKQISVSIFYTSINGIKLKINTFYFDIKKQIDAMVDLGLSVKWASCNIGATSPEKPGNYYAWGEISSKSEYTWLTYHLCEGNTTTLLKYSFGIDNKLELELSDDVARKTLGGEWRIPTLAEQRELATQCDWIYTSRKGINGYLVKSKKNNNSIFLPVTGCKTGVKLYGEKDYGYYWSSTININDNTEAWILNFSTNGPGFYNSNRYIGRCIRSVCP